MTLSFLPPDVQPQLLGASQHPAFEFPGLTDVEALRDWLARARLEGGSDLRLDELLRRLEGLAGRWPFALPDTTAVRGRYGRGRMFKEEVAQGLIMHLQAINGAVKTFTSPDRWPFHNQVVRPEDAPAELAALVKAYPKGLEAVFTCGEVHLYLTKKTRIHGVEYPDRTRVRFLPGDFGRLKLAPRGGVTATLGPPEAERFPPVPLPQALLEKRADERLSPADRLIPIAAADALRSDIYGVAWAPVVERSARLGLQEAAQTPSEFVATDGFVALGVRSPLLPPPAWAKRLRPMWPPGVLTAGPPATALAFHAVNPRVVTNTGEFPDYPQVIAGLEGARAQLAVSDAKMKALHTQLRAAKLPRFLAQKGLVLRWVASALHIGTAIPGEAEAWNLVAEDKGYRTAHSETWDSRVGGRAVLPILRAFAALPYPTRWYCTGQGVRGELDPWVLLQDDGEVLRQWAIVMPFRWRDDSDYKWEQW